jgi:hypothetical protein
MKMMIGTFMDEKEVKKRMIEDADQESPKEAHTLTHTQRKKERSKNELDSIHDSEPSLNNNNRRVQR